MRVIVACLATMLVNCDDVGCPRNTDEINGRCIVKEGDSTAGTSATSVGAGDMASTAPRSTTGTGGMSQPEDPMTSGKGGSSVQESGTGGETRMPDAGTGDDEPSSDATPNTAGSAAPQGGTDSASNSGGMAGTGGGSGSSGETASSGARAPGPMCTPDLERCDNNDNDCDGEIDEDVPPRPCGKTVPPCKQGAESCVAGAWSTECVGEVKPTEEVCDGIDNDCSGTADEGCQCKNGDTLPCGLSTPPCRQGVKTCTDGVWPAECAGEIRSTAEVCDGMDNDCDGTDDDGGDALCTGGKKCADGRCVECTSNSDCASRRTETCQANYCDMLTHQCSQRAAEEGSPCSAVPNGMCTGTRCVACVSSGDCPSGYDCSSNACVKRPACGDGQIDAGETCDNGSNNGDDNDCTSECKLNRCGDRKWNSKGTNREECEIGARSSFGDGRVWDEWSCDPSSCRRRYAHTPCSGDSDCNGGRCDGTAGCIRDCTLSSELDLGPDNCEVIPGRGGMCYGACMTDCSGGQSCPRGLSCTNRLGQYPDGTPIFVCTL